MLQKLHENIKGWVASVIIAILCLAFALWGIQYYVDGESGSGKVLAEIAGKKVTVRDVDALYRQMQQQAVASGIPLSPELNNRLKSRALNTAMMQTLLSQSALKAGFVATQSQAQQLILSFPAFQQQGKFSLPLLQQFLSNRGITEQSYFRELQTQILISQVANGIELSAFVLPDELKTYYDLIMQERSFGYLLISSHQFMPQLKVTDKQIAHYYKNNKDQFREPEKVSIQYIELSPKAVASSVKLSDAQLLQYYQDNIGNYRTSGSWQVQRITIPVAANASAAEITAARHKVQKIVDDVSKGESFAKLMQQYKGEKQTLTEGQMASNLQSALQNLKPGQVSAPINTPVGYVILRLVNQTAAHTTPFSKVKPKIKQLLTRQQTQREIADRNEKLSNLTFTNPDSLNPAAKALGVAVQSSQPFSRAGAKEGIALNPEVVKAAFSDEVLKQGNNSNPITLKEGGVVVFRVKNHLKSQLKPLKEVAPQVRMQLLGQMADVKAALLANKLQEEINQGKKPEDLARQNHLQWIVKQEVSRNAKAIQPALLTGVFNMAPAQLHKATTVTLEKGDTAVIYLQKIAQPDFYAISGKEKLAFKQQIQNFLGQLNYHLYRIGAEAGAKEKVYPQNLKTME